MKKNLKKLIVLFTCLTILLSVSMVQVYAAPSISAKKVSVYVGKTKQLKVSGTSTSVKWTTSNSKIVTVSSKGLIDRLCKSCLPPEQRRPDRSQNCIWYRTGLFMRSRWCWIKKTSSVITEKLFVIIFVIKRDYL